MDLGAEVPKLETQTSMPRRHRTALCAQTNILHLYPGHVQKPWRIKDYIITFSRSIQRQMMGLFHHLMQPHDDLQCKSMVQLVCLFFHICKASCCEMSLTTAGPAKATKNKPQALKKNYIYINTTNFYCCSSRAKPRKPKTSRTSGQKNATAQTTVSKARIVLLFARHLQHLESDLTLIYHHSNSSQGGCL